MAKAPKYPKQVDALRHSEATRRNIPTAEMESFFRREEDSAPMPPKHYPRARPLAEGETRTDEEPGAPELIWNGAKITITPAQMAELAETGTLTLADAQLVWRGKDRQDWSDLVVNVPPLYIQEKIQPQAIIADLKRRTAEAREAQTEAPDMFADFNGLPADWAEEGFYKHDGHWSNRMILGDSLQVMASLSERESLKGKVQCIFFDPPYGIKFNSNWQVSTQSRDVKDGKQADISREPEQVKAFRDTWKDGIHSYLTYLRDRLTAMRDLLTESGSIFVQIGDENVHRVRALMDEVFGSNNIVALAVVAKTAGATSEFLPPIADYIIWYGKNIDQLKYRPQHVVKNLESGGAEYKSIWLKDGSSRPATKAELAGEIPEGARLFRPSATTSQRPPGSDPFIFQGKTYTPSQSQYWKTSVIGLERLAKADRIIARKTSVSYRRTLADFPVMSINNIWTDLRWGFDASEKRYVVETNPRVVQRCILMATDPGDLVLDPTCGSGTTAFAAEQWGRRWITIDTSRVALALARTRLMAARYPWYLLADSRDGRAKEAALMQRKPADSPIHDDIRQGFVYERVPHITLKSIANNPLIDDIWEKWQTELEPLRASLNSAMDEEWQEWQIPRALPPEAPTTASDAHSKWWEGRIARQHEIDASIAARADVEYLYDKPYQDSSRVRVAGPFTVESLSPHRVLPASEEELIETIDAADGKRAPADADLASHDFAAIVIDYLKAEGVKLSCPLLSGPSPMIAWIKEGTTNAYQEAQARGDHREAA